MLKNEKGMALIPLILTIFVLLALAGATIFMIGDGFLYNKDVKDIDLNTSIYYVVNFFNMQHKLEEVEDELVTDEWKLFRRYKNLRDITTNNDKIELPDINPDILNHYPQPRYGAWESEYISKEVCDYMNIHYNLLR